jgi:4-hydroxy-3-polyprenylbenzoate decarboxylase
MYRDLREFLDKLEKLGDLVKVKKTIEDGHEIFSIIWELNNIKGPAVLFEKVKGFDIPVVGNIFGTVDRFALACGFPQGRPVKEYRDLFRERLRKEHWAKPKTVDKGPCKEVILKGEEIDLTRFPILQWHPMDGGKYITMPIVITKDQKFGVNASFYRMMIHDKRTTGIMCNIFQDIGIHLGRAIKEGRDYLECAVAIGADPSIYEAAATKLPIYDNELCFAASFRGGQPIDVVKCETVDLEVPAHAEIVLEGRISVKERRAEGPFGEWTGYFEEQMMLPIFEVQCITHRKDPLYLMTTEGHYANDDGIMRMISQITTFTDSALKNITGCVDAWIPQSARNYITVVAIKKRYPGWGKVAIYQALALPFIASSSNCVIVVDDDIDPSDMDQVLWAVATRVDPSQDIIVTPPIGGYPLNPAASHRLFEFNTTRCTDISICPRWGIDATIKMEGEGNRSRPPVIPVRPMREMWEKVKRNWKEYGFK